jgi:hypothetical protein
VLGLGLRATAAPGSWMSVTKYATHTCARRFPTVDAGRLWLSWAYWSGGQKRLMINQPTQDHATARPLLGWLLGRRERAFIRPPGLHKYLDERAPGMGCTY